MNLCVVLLALMCNAAAVSCQPQCQPGNGKQGYLLDHNAQTRLVSAAGGTQCDKDIAANGVTWIRFLLNGSQNAVLASHATPTDRCGAQATGFVRSTAGNVHTVCFSWDNNECNWRNGVPFTECPGGYIVYNVTNTLPLCSLRYCVEPQGASVPTALPPTTAASAPTTTRSPTGTPPADPCASLTTCAACTRAKPSRACFWCLTSGTCESSTLPREQCPDALQSNYLCAYCRAQ